MGVRNFLLAPLGCYLWIYLERAYIIGSGNELIELYDYLSVLCNSLPLDTHPEWNAAMKSVLYDGEWLAKAASCYGKQQSERNRGTRAEYVQTHGNGERVTEFSTIAVLEPRPEDRRHVPSGAVLPVAPESGAVLPVIVSENDIDQAIALLAEFPAEPAADRSGDGGDVLLDRARVRRTRERPGRDSALGGEVTVLFVSDTHLGYENRERTGSGKRVNWVSEISSRRAFDRLSQIAITRTRERAVR